MGITTEALKKIIDFFFNMVEITEIQARHNIENIASGAVMKKAGMKYDGRKRVELSKKLECVI